MLINKKTIELKALEVITKHIIQPQLREDLELFTDLENYHMVTPELAKKMGDLNYGDDYTESIGRYAYLSYYGASVTIDFIMNLDHNENEITEGVEFNPIDGYESLISNGHFNETFSCNGGMDLNDMSDMIKYAVLCLLEAKSNKKA